MQSILNMSNKGNVKVGFLIGLLIFLVMASALAPTFFSGWNSSSLGSNAPTWLPTLMQAIIAGVLVLAIWRSYGSK